MKSSKMRRLMVCAAMSFAALQGRSAFAQILEQSNYGNFTAKNVQYQNVTETSTTNNSAVYGSPIVTTASNSIVFPDSSFSAVSNNGAAGKGGGATDTTEGDLTSTVQAGYGYKFLGLNFTEDGDFTLSGTGTAATNVSITAPITVKILALNGTPLGTPISDPTTITFSPVSPYTLPVYGGGTDTIFSGTVNLMNLDTLIAANNDTGSATLISWDLNTTLTATSESQSSAFINTKITSNNDTITMNPVTTGVPEPASAGLLLAGAIGMMMRRRRA
jgi:hypothetical protein